MYTAVLVESGEVDEHLDRKLQRVTYCDVG